MTITQTRKACRFRALHAEGKLFVIPNPWDTGSARVLADMGYQALATSSGAAANVLGKKDHELSRDEALAHARMIVAATDLPVSADFENGFGDSPEIVAETVRLAADAGLVGCSIEDSTRHPDQPQYPLAEAVARIEAAVAAARALPFEFTLTARAENFVSGNPDLDDTIARLQAYEAAGADVLFAIGLPDLDAVRAVCRAVTLPVNFMCGIPGRSFPLAELEAAGVRRVSTGTSLYGAAMRAATAAAGEVHDRGTFNYLPRPG